jgi:hypothetical protein
MIKAESTKTEIHIAIEGTASDIMCELKETISAVYGLLKKEMCADDAKLEILHLTGLATRASEGENHEE